MSEEIRDRVDTRLQNLSDTVSEYRSWFLFSSIALIALGVLAIFFPLVTTIAAKVMLGWVILIGGAIQTFHAYRSAGRDEHDSHGMGLSFLGYAGR